MTWKQPELLHLLWLVGGLAIGMLLVSYWRRTVLKRLGDPELVGRLTASRDARKRFLKNLLALIACAGAVVSLAQPQLFLRKINVVREGVDLAIVVDVSLSMLAEDVAPSRLERIKQELDRIARGADADRFTLLAFSGETTCLSPLTGDRGLIRRQIGELEADMLPSKGTSLGSAMRAGLDSFFEKQRKARILLLITDGEDNETYPVYLAEEARRDRIVVFIVGVGRSEGAKIPLKGKDGRAAYKLDENGQLVYTRMNEPLLMSIARASGGTYLSCEQADESFAGPIIEAVAAAKQGEAFHDVVVEHENLFQWPLLVAALALLAEVSLSERRGGK